MSKLKPKKKSCVSSSPPDFIRNNFFVSFRKRVSIFDSHFCDFQIFLKCSKSLKPYRRSHPDVFCKKGILRNFTKFTGKHLCQSLFFNKVAGLRPATLLKKRLWHRCFPANFVKFLRTPFFIEHLCWLLVTLSLILKV